MEEIRKEEGKAEKAFFDRLQETVEAAGKDPRLQEALQRTSGIKPGFFDRFLYKVKGEKGNTAFFQVQTHTPPEGVEIEGKTEEEIASMKPHEWPTSIKWFGVGTEDEVRASHPKANFEPGNKLEGGNILVIEVGQEDAEKVLKGELDPIRLAMAKGTKMLKGDLTFAMRNPRQIQDFFEIAGEHYTKKI
jgi:hypothetical protein